jgi:hypothetical protein
MSEKKKDELLHDHNHDGIDRRGFLKCMAWAGTGAFCVMKGGVLNSYSLSRISETSTSDMMGELSFVQISDSHMGFNKPAEQLKSVLGITNVNYVQGQHALAVVDSTLA